jgi:hypothetical protein
MTCAEVAAFMTERTGHDPTRAELVVISRTSNERASPFGHIPGGQSGTFDCAYFKYLDKHKGTSQETMLSIADYRRFAEKMLAALKAAGKS